MIHGFIFYEDPKEEKTAIEVAEHLRKQYPYTVMVKQGTGYEHRG